MAGFSSPKYNHVKHCSTHPKFLHSNSTSHRWAFGAIAELIDNAIDPDVNASQFCIDLKEFNNEPCLVLMDNGSGLNPERLHKMLSFGHSKKQLTPGDRSIGKHGNGFKSGTMRLGKDVLVLTKCAVSMTAGFLSQTFLAAVGAEDILIPLVSWDLRGDRLSPKHADIEESLQAICSYSIFPDEASILAQLDAIPGTGTILIISNLRRHEGVLEMDYKTDPHDIRITSEITNSHYQQLRPNQPNSTDVPSDYSLRAYVSILYKVPRMQIFIRDCKVKTKRVAGLLSQKETDSYRPMGVSEAVKIELGFNTENRNLYGMMLYHRNRLIKPYMRVGMQLEENERGMGVLGIVEADFLQPTHNKQDFDDTTAYRRLLKKLSDVLAEYWWEKKERASTPLLELPAKRPLEKEASEENFPDVVWVQCDNPSCLKWRVLPDGTDPSTLPETWFCEYHPDPKFRRHEEPEQEWDATIHHEIIDRRRERKREYDREKKEKEAHRRRQRLEVIVNREEQMVIQRQKEMLKKELEEQLSKDALAREKERREAEDEKRRLSKELAELQAKRNEMLQQNNELLKTLEANGEKRTVSGSTRKQNDENHVQFSEHEISQVGVSASESEEAPVDSRKEDDACSAQQNLLNENPDTGGAQFAGQRNRNESELAEAYQQRLETQFAMGDGFEQQHQRSFSRSGMDQQAGRDPQHQEAMDFRDSREMVENGGYKFQQQEAQYFGHREKAHEAYHHSTESQFDNSRSKNLELHPQLYDRQLAVPTFNSATDKHFQEQRSSANDMLQIMANSSEALNSDAQSQKTDNHKFRMLKGYSDTVPPIQQQVLQEGMPAFVSPFSQSKQHFTAQQEQSYGHGHTLGPLSSFQNLPGSESRSVFQDGSRNMLTLTRASEGQHQQSIEYPGLENDLQRLSTGAFPPERLTDCNASSLSLCNDSMLVPRAELSIASRGVQRRETESSLVVSLQGRLRMALKTLLKISGPLDPQMMDVDEMLLNDLDVISLCEKAKGLVGMRWQAYEQEISKLKGELAYIMSDKLQNGQSFRIRSLGDNWEQLG